MPIIGLGTFKSAEGEQVVHEVGWALEAGYRLIDTAKIYGNEEGVGRAIKDSGIPREEIFVTTKLWNTDQGYESALLAIDESLKKLGMSYVDLYLVHWPTASADTKESLNKRQDTWRAMEEIYRSGKARAIGVSNYMIPHLDEMKKYATVVPAVNQVEFHPFLYQKELLNYCNKGGIALQAYSPLLHGEKLGDERISNVAQKYGKTNAQILIRWSLQHGCSPIPKSVRKERIENNIDVFNFEIADEDMEVLDGLNEDLHVRANPYLLK